jgi:hypothetical protein
MDDRFGVLSSDLHVRGEQCVHAHRTLKFDIEGLNVLKITSVSRVLDVRWEGTHR